MAVADEFSELFSAEYGRLVRALGVGFGVGPAEDAVQEAFLQLRRRWSKVQTYENKQAWVRRVAYHRLLNLTRDEQRHAEVHPRLVDRSDHRTPHDHRLDVRSAIASLPPQMRSVICLHYIADFSVAETADALGIAEGTVKATLHSAREHLRHTLGDDYVRLDP